MRQIQDRRAGLLATAATAVLFGAAAAPGALAQGTAGQAQPPTQARGGATQGGDLQGAEEILTRLEIEITRVAPALRAKASGKPSGQVTPTV